LRGNPSPTFRRPAGQRPVSTFASSSSSSALPTGLRLLVPAADLDLTVAANRPAWMGSNERWPFVDAAEGDI